VPLSLLVPAEDEVEAPLGWPLSMSSGRLGDSSFRVRLGGGGLLLRESGEGPASSFSVSSPLVFASESLKAVG
jgi:hypothetical protein